MTEYGKLPYRYPCKAGCGEKLKFPGQTCGSCFLRALKAWKTNRGAEKKRRP